MGGSKLPAYTARRGVHWSVCVIGAGFGSVWFWLLESSLHVAGGRWQQVQAAFAADLSGNHIDGRAGYEGADIVFNHVRHGV